MLSLIVSCAKICEASTRMQTGEADCLTPGAGSPQLPICFILGNTRIMKSSYPIQGDTGNKICCPCKDLRIEIWPRRLRTAQSERDDLGNYREHQLQAAILPMGYLVHCTYKASVGQQRARTTITLKAAPRAPRLLPIVVQSSGQIVSVSV